MKSIAVPPRAKPTGKPRKIRPKRHINNATVHISKGIEITPHSN
jgi:hypothetical protein